MMVQSLSNVKTLPKIIKDLLKLHQSGEISPNLVTLQVTDTVFVRKI